MKPRVPTAPGFLKSLRHAAHGLRVMLTTQPNAQLHLVAALAVLGLGIVCEITRWEWCVLILTIAVVWITEALNTAVECLGDAVTREHHPLIGRAKDVSAGAVLVAAGTSVITGGLIFIPRLIAG